PARVFLTRSLAAASAPAPRAISSNPTTSATPVSDPVRGSVIPSTEGLSLGVGVGAGVGPAGGAGGTSGEGEMVGAGVGSTSSAPWAADGWYRSVPANVAVYPPARMGTATVRGDALLHDARPSALVTAVQIGVPSEALKVMVWPGTGTPLLVSVALTADRLTAVDKLALSAVSVVAAGT